MSALPIEIERLDVEILRCAKHGVLPMLFHAAARVLHDVEYPEHYILECSQCREERLGADVSQAIQKWNNNNTGG